MATYKWGPPTALPDGHRQFTTDNPDKIAVADNSGREPQDCDDGILWYDFTTPLGIVSDKFSDTPREHFSIPLLIDGSFEKTRTPSNAATVLLLSSMHGWDINVHGVLFRAHQK
jgi:hypothetical protein